MQSWIIDNFNRIMSSEVDVDSTPDKEFEKILVECIDSGNALEAIKKAYIGGMKNGAAVMFWDPPFGSGQWSQIRVWLKNVGLLKKAREIISNIDHTYTPAGDSMLRKKLLKLETEEVFLTLKG